MTATAITITGDNNDGDHDLEQGAYSNSLLRAGGIRASPTVRTSRQSAAEPWQRSTPTIHGNSGGAAREGRDEISSGRQRLSCHFEPTGSACGRRETTNRLPAWRTGGRSATHRRARRWWLAGSSLVLGGKLGRWVPTINREEDPGALGDEVGDGQGRQQQSWGTASSSSNSDGKVPATTRGAQRKRGTSPRSSGVSLR